MANRTTPQKVLAVVPHVEQGFDCSLFISQANRLINRVLVDTLEETDTAVLTDLETCLAGHFISVVNPPLASESGTGVSGSYARGQLTKGLDSTPAGQMCKAYDRTGRLGNAILGKTEPYVLEFFGT